MRLALARDARRRDHLSGDEHLDVRALVRTDTRSFDVDADSHPDVVALRFRAKPGDRLVEQRRVVAAVVDDRVAVLPRDADVVGKLVRLDQVAAPHLDAVEAEL